MMMMTKFQKLLTAAFKITFINLRVFIGIDFVMHLCSILYNGPTIDFLKIMMMMMMMMMMMKSCGRTSKQLLSSRTTESQRR